MWITKTSWEHVLTVANLLITFRNIVENQLWTTYRVTITGRLRCHLLVENESNNHVISAVTFYSFWSQNATPRALRCIGREKCRMSPRDLSVITMTESSILLHLHVATWRKKPHSIRSLHGWTVSSVRLNGTGHTIKIRLQRFSRWRKYVRVTHTTLHIDKGLSSVGLRSFYAFSHCYSGLGSNDATALRVRSITSYSLLFVPYIQIRKSGRTVP